MAIGRIGKYEILERIGEGGMGVVFRAHDPQLLRTVAIKILPERLQLDHDYHERLLCEARAPAAVSNHHIAVCHECDEGVLEPADLLSPGTSSPHPETVDYIVMEYVPGQDLRTFITARVVPMKEALRLAVQISSGIDAAHEAGVIHRDLTPANIRLTPAGEIKILDFGLARSGARPESRSTVSANGQTIAGTLGYMAPEQAEGRPIDRRTDLFSFGVILYQMVTGRIPFEGPTTLAVLYAIANTTPPPLARFAAGVPTELQRIVDKLLEKAPANRYPSAREVHTDLLRRTSYMTVAGSGS